MKNLQHVKFIFVTTNFNSLPITVRSRSQCFCFNLVSNNLIKDLILRVSKEEGINLNEDLVNIITLSSSGSPRRALVTLEAVICKIKSGSSTEDIFKTLGLIGYKNFTNFIAYHIFGDFNGLYKNSSVFLEQHVDLEKAISDLQQFIIDTRIGLIYPQNISNLRSDVSSLLELINQQQQGSGMDERAYRQYVNKRLDSMRELSINLSKNIPYVYNKNALISGFVVDLALSWK